MPPGRFCMVVVFRLNKAELRIPGIAPFRLYLEATEHACCYYSACISVDVATGTDD